MSEHFPLLYRLTWRYQDPRKVGVERAQAVAVVDFDVQPIVLGLAATREGYGAGCRRDNWRDDSVVEADINPEGMYGPHDACNRAGGRPDEGVGSFDADDDGLQVLNGIEVRCRIASQVGDNSAGQVSDRAYRQARKLEARLDHSLVDFMGVAVGRGLG